MIKLQILQTIEVLNKSLFRHNLIKMADKF